jgi:predicted DsbA family dithiol-disulfide isomerase
MVFQQSAGHAMNHCRLFSDLNCPFCYAMHERLYALGVMEQVSWHGVQHARHLRLPMVAWSGHLAMELKREVEMVRRLAPEVPIALPAGKPNSGPAIAAAARALSIDTIAGQKLLQSLYRLFWIQGQDISDEELLQREAERHGFSPAQIAGMSAIPIDQTLRAWEERWNETEHQGVPLLQRPNHRLLIGLVPVESVRQFLAGE